MFPLGTLFLLTAALLSRAISTPTSVTTTTTPTSDPPLKQYHAQNAVFITSRLPKRAPIPPDPVNHILPVILVPQDPPLKPQPTPVPVASDPQIQPPTRVAKPIIPVSRILDAPIALPPAPTTQCIYTSTLSVNCSADGQLVSASSLRRRYQ